MSMYGYKETMCLPPWKCIECIGVCVCININHFLIQVKGLGAEKLTGMVMRVMSGRAKP